MEDEVIGTVQIAPLEIDDQARELQEVHAQFDVLDGYYTEIQRVGGVTRAQATALVRDCGLQLDQSTPMNSFTEEPSRTNLSVAMEGMLASIGRGIVTLVKKAAELLMRLLRWVGELLRKLFTKQESDEDKLKKMQAVNQLNVKVKAILNEANVDADTVAKSPTLQAVNEAMERYKIAHNGLAADLLSRKGVLGPAMAGLCIEMTHVLEWLERKVDVFQAVLTTPTDLPMETQERLAIEQLADVSNPIAVQSMTSFLARSHIRINGGHTVKDVIEGVYAHVNALQGQIVPADVPDAMYLRLSATDHPIHQPIVLAGAELGKSVEKLAEQVQRLTAINTTELATSRQADALRKAQATLKSEHEAVVRFGTLIAMCEGARQNVLHALIGLAQAEGRHQEALLRQADLTPEQTRAYNDAVAQAKRNAA